MSPSLVGLLQESVIKYPSLAALKTVNPDGSQLILTYAELYTAVRELGTGLITVGLHPGQHVAIVCENHWRWLVTDLAILGCGGVDVPLSLRMGDRELEYMLSHSECEVAVVESEAELARVAAMRRSLPKLRRIICLDLAGPRPRLEGETARVLVHPWAEVMKKGQARLAKGDRQFDLRAAAVTAADTATIVYTSGTSGRPKGVILTHGNIMHNVTTMHTAIVPRPGMTWLSVLPVWSVFERIAEYCSLSFGTTIAYSQPSEWKMVEDLAVHKPAYLVVEPALLADLQRGLERRLGFLGSLAITFEKFYAVFAGFIAGRYPRFRREERALEIFAAILPLALLSPLKAITHPILRKRMATLTGGSLRAIVCGGAPLAAWLDRWFYAAGVTVLEGYGLTETSPVVSVRSEEAPVLGTAGRPLPYTEVKVVGEDGAECTRGVKGRVLVRGPQVMRGYYRDEPATREVLSADGWLATGDMGMLTLDGNLVVLGRSQHTITLRSGELLEPEPLETLIAESPYIQDAVVVGENREGPAVLVVPALEELARWASERGIPFDDGRELVHNPAVFRFYQEEVQARVAAGGLSLPGGRMPRLALLPSRFEVGRELTRTHSKRREVIARLHEGVIERLYRS
ncbi:MAG: AMP-binding protein [Spirochaetes bacterium]|nr:AMP-binding protein [Spirochaetota bacterium]